MNKKLYFHCNIIVYYIIKTYTKTPEAENEPKTHAQFTTVNLQPVDHFIKYEVNQTKFLIKFTDVTKNIYF